MAAHDKLLKNLLETQGLELLKKQHRQGRWIDKKKHLGYSLIEMWVWCFKNKPSFHILVRLEGGGGERQLAATSSAIRALLQRGPHRLSTVGLLSQWCPQTLIWAKQEEWKRMENISKIITSRTTFLLSEITVVQRESSYQLLSCAIQLSGPSTETATNHWHVFFPWLCNSVTILTYYIFAFIIVFCNFFLQVYQKRQGSSFGLKYEASNNQNSMFPNKLISDNGTYRLILIKISVLALGFTNHENITKYTTVLSPVLMTLICFSKKKKV